MAKNPLYKKNGRYYADFRRYRDVGGGQEAMIPPGERHATKDYRMAKRLAKERRAELRRLRKANLGPEHGDLRRLGPFVDYHLDKEARRADANLATLSQVAQRLGVSVRYFGADTLLREIDRDRKCCSKTLAIPDPDRVPPSGSVSDDPRLFCGQANHSPVCQALPRVRIMRRQVNGGPGDGELADRPQCSGRRRLAPSHG